MRFPRGRRPCRDFRECPRGPRRARGWTGVAKQVSHVKIRVATSFPNAIFPRKICYPGEVVWPVAKDLSVPDERVVYLRCGKGLRDGSASLVYIFCFPLFPQFHVRYGNQFGIFLVHETLSQTITSRSPSDSPSNTSLSALGAGRLRLATGPPSELRQSGRAPSVQAKFAKIKAIQACRQTRRERKPRLFNTFYTHFDSENDM